MSPIVVDGNRRRSIVDMHPDVTPPEPVRLVTRARPVLPCERCAHALVCSIRAGLDIAALEVRAPESPNEALRIGIRIDVECRHFLEGAVEVLPVIRPTSADRVAAARRGGAATKAKTAPAVGGGPVKVGRTPRHTDAEIEAAVAKHGSNAAAGRALGLSGWTISTRLRTIARRRAASPGSGAAE